VNNSKLHRRFFVVVFLSFLLAFAFLSAQIKSDIFAGLKARSIGPANMSGRIGAIECVPSDPSVVYVGGAAGGVWKSTDSGLTWTPIFDDQPVSSIGAIAVFPKNPNIVWVGTGEGAPRNSVSIGRGVFLSLDAGRTWKAVGLEKTERIAKIVTHPDDPDTVLVAALGAAWGDSQERGVYKTTDGGKTWKKVLYVNEKTGAADIAMDPSNPNKVLAAMWEYRRWPWFFSSGGPGSGVYISTDGGEKWDKLTDKNGLPAGDLGRCGLAFAPGRPLVVYAIVEAKKSAFMRSTDGGFTWQTVNDSNNIDSRPFYYSRLWVNPMNENLIYMLATQLSMSEDGGKTFRPLTSFSQVHSDFHAMYIYPDGERMVVGNDGGVVVSTDRGLHWRYVANLPLGQYYHVNLDAQYPYHAYGGLQDNGSWVGPTYSLKDRTLANDDWVMVGDGDGFDAAPDTDHPGCGYAMSQGGSLYYFDTAMGTSRNIVPTESDVKDRYNWNAGFAVDPFHAGTIYLGSQFVHRSADRGRTWEVISPDLTTNDAEKLKQSESGGLTLDVSNAENYCTILSIAPSPLREGLIWVGTDDGNVQLTRDGGKSWELVTKTLVTGKKPPAIAGGEIPHIEPSHYDEATAYLVVDDHRRSNFTPYVCVTRDYGKTWKSLVAADVDGYCQVVREDPVNKDLLFLGTELGLFVSLNGGTSWLKWTAGFPTCPVYDLAIQPRESDLVIATHGRSLYVIDDIGPLREISEEITKKKLYLFKVPEADEFQQGRMSSYMSPGDTAFSGENKPAGACITYFLTPSEKKPEEKAEPAPAAPQTGMMMGFGRGGRTAGQRPGRVSITILDTNGKFVSQFSGTENKGINRVYWNLRETEEPSRQEEQPTEERGAGMFFRRAMGVAVLPGTYTARIKYEDQETIQSFEVKTDPRLKVDVAVLKANYDKAKQAEKLARIVMRAGRQLQQTQRAIQTVRESVRATRNPKAADITKAAEALEKKLKELQETLSPTPAKQGMADRSASLQGQVMSAVMGIASAGIEPVTQAAQVKYDKVVPKVEEFLGKFNDFYEKDVEAFKKDLRDADFSLFGTFTALKIE
jgi:photosystem II stability/assembly factor-like uncharacterized protein